MRTIAFLTAAGVCIQLAAAPAAVAASNLPVNGEIQSALFTSSTTDPFTTTPNATGKTWLHRHFKRAVVYSPYWDSRLSWFPNVWTYNDLYALYTSGDPLPVQHPDWILKDAKGNPLYIPWGCSNGTCPQYAGDPGNQAFRRQWITDAQALLKKGYGGIFIDDANLQMRVGDSNGNPAVPIDPRTRKPMTNGAWEKYVADFLNDIRLAIPDKELVQNQIWYASTTPGSLDSFVTEAVNAADYVYLERGISDPGLTGGTGPYSTVAFLNFIDQVHSLNKNVIFGEYTYNGDYPIAGYLAINDGGDLFVNASATPSNWWSAYDQSLGTATSGRYFWNGLLRRDFTGGFILLNLPQSRTITANLGAAYLNTSGKTVSSVILKAGEGAVLSNIK